MDSYEKKFKQAVQDVFNEMDSLTDEEFHTEIEKYQNHELTTILLDAESLGRSEKDECSFWDSLYEPRHAKVNLTWDEIISVQIDWDENDRCTETYIVSGLNTPIADSDSFLFETSQVPHLNQQNLVFEKISSKTRPDEYLYDLAA